MGHTDVAALQDQLGMALEHENLNIPMLAPWMLMQEKIFPSLHASCPLRSSCLESAMRRLGAQLRRLVRIMPHVVLCRVQINCTGNECMLSVAVQVCSRTTHSQVRFGPERAQNGRCHACCAGYRVPGQGCAQRQERRALSILVL